jgi:hypothetical protein
VFRDHWESTLSKYLKKKLQADFVSRPYKFSPSKRLRHVRAFIAIGDYDASWFLCGASKKVMQATTIRG